MKLNKIPNSKICLFFLNFCTKLSIETKRKRPGKNIPTIQTVHLRLQFFHHHFHCRYHHHALLFTLTMMFSLISTLSSAFNRHQNRPKWLLSMMPIERLIKTAHLCHIFPSLKNCLLYRKTSQTHLDKQWPENGNFPRVKGWRRTLVEMKMCATKGHREWTFERYWWKRRVSPVRYCNRLVTFISLHILKEVSFFISCSFSQA